MLVQVGSIALLLFILAVALSFRETGGKLAPAAKTMAAIFLVVAITAFVMFYTNLPLQAPEPRK